MFTVFLKNSTALATPSPRTSTHQTSLRTCRIYHTFHTHTHTHTFTHTSTHQTSLRTCRIFHTFHTHTHIRLLSKLADSTTHTFTHQTSLKTCRIYHINIIIFLRQLVNFTTTHTHTHTHTFIHPISLRCERERIVS